MTIEERINVLLQIAEGKDAKAKISITDAARISNERSANEFRQEAQWLEDYLKSLKNAKDHIKSRLFEKALYNVGVTGPVDNVINKIAEKDIDIWFDEIIEKN